MVESHPEVKGGRIRTARLLGILSRDNQVKVNIPEKDRSMWSQERYKFFLDAPFEIGAGCCQVMKKNPAHAYTKQTGRKPMTAQMASESRVRAQKWVKSGCNGFDLAIPTSNPMAFWTEQDVLLYIYLNHVPICSIYGDVIPEGEVPENADKAYLFDEDRPTLKTTGANRTGCMFCGFGCHLEKPGEGRFERMRITHPKQYEYIMKPKSEGGLGYTEVIDWINEHGNLHIRY